MVAAHALGDLGEIARALKRHDGAAGGGLLDCDPRQPPLSDRKSEPGELRRDGLIERRHPVVIEACSDSAVDRHLLRPPIEQHMVALILLAHIVQGVFRAAAFELVDGDEVGEVQHVDLFELARGAEFRRHHIDRHVGDLGDRRVALADPGGLDDDQVEAGRLAGGDRVGNGGRQFGARAARRERAHIDVRMIERVHADAVAEQGSAGAPPGRVDRQHGDLQLVLIVQPEPADQFVGEARLARAAGAGEAENRRLLLRCVGKDGPDLGGAGAVLARRDDARERPPVAPRKSGRIGGQPRGEIEIGAGDDVVDHPLQAHDLPVFRRVDAGDPIGVELGDLVGHDHPAAAAEHLDVGRPRLAQQVEHVFEEFDVPALIGGHRDAVDVLLHGGGDDFLDRAVVAEINHLDAVRLQQPAHDVDGGVMPVEQAGRGNEPNLVARAIGGGRCVRPFSDAARLRRHLFSSPHFVFSPRAVQIGSRSFPEAEIQLRKRGPPHCAGRTARSAPA